MRAFESEYDDQIPDEWENVYDKYTGLGHTPSVVAASIDYLDSCRDHREKRTQESVADDFDVTVHAISRLYFQIDDDIQVEKPSL